MKTNKKMLLKEIKRCIPIYLLFLPGAIYLIINNYIPMAGLVIAFKKYRARDGIWGSKWCGLNNFKFLFQTKDAWIITRNTLLYNSVFIMVNLIFAIIFAIFIADLMSKIMKKVYQSVILFPYLMSTVVLGYIVYAFLSQSTGMINNSILEPLGIEGINWYTKQSVWPFLLTFVNLWKGVGYGCLIYIAGINGIDPELFEAARLDGASKWQQIRYITLPSLVPTIITLTIMSVGQIFRSDFGLFYQIPRNSGSLLNVTNTLDTYVYRGLMERSDIGMSSAAGFYQSIVGFILVLVVNGIVRKKSRENALF